MASESDIQKTIIRITQDYCFRNSASILCNEFAMTIAPHIAKQLNMGGLDLARLHIIVGKRKDFFIANEIDISIFCKGLFKKLNYELAFYEYESFYDSIVTFKRKMENGNGQYRQDIIPCMLLYRQCIPRIMGALHKKRCQRMERGFQEGWI